MKKISIILIAVLISSVVWSGLNDDLFEAVKKGDKKKVAALIKKGVKVNAEYYHGFTPLHETASNGKTEMARLLIKGLD